MKSLPVIHPVFILICVCALAGYHNAYGIHEENSIQIQYPNSTTTIYGGNSFTATGTWIDTNSSASPSIVVYLDKISYTPTLSGNTWAVQFSGLVSGYHDIKAVISDQERSDFAETQFLSINGHLKQQKYNMIIIKESNTCLKLLQSGTKSKCPTLGQLASVDTSDQNIAGKIIQDHDNQWTRTKPAVKMWWNFISETGKPIICVECNFDYSLISTIQMITLVPDYFSFPTLDINQNDTHTEWYYNGTQELSRQVQSPGVITSLNVNHDRYVSDDCMDSSIVYSSAMLADTISYLESGCKYTNLHLNSTITIQPIAFDFDNPYSTLHYDKLVQQARQQSDLNCMIQKCNVTGAYHNHDPKFGW